MAGLLISVCDADEAQLALEGGADLIDVKQPRGGALGAPSPRALAAVSRTVRGRVPLSVAMGELGESVDRSSLLSIRGVVFAKVGLAEAGADWRQRWMSLIAQFPPHVQPVAVAYADQARARSPSPEEVLAVAARVGCQALLVDTYCKDGGGLLDWMPLRDLGDLLKEAQDLGLLAVVAGSLDVLAVERVLKLQPDYVAVRGAACAGGRTGRVELKRVRRLAGMVRAATVDRLWERGGAITV
ncbi:MAG: hypothetical protein GTO53_05345 [Planctomycetales bacterium]|nr:hypothetical protein [Planctomycetales bacterium]NIM08574.1 hypothetical protein [Planctomycetales bacterium]NIN08043.1 hypothetical protein [Planctomycetales bacterium]NIN77179.1 hypothetical protein [Planctomycetales bacterium]NIO34361.1 hypothetical protein [Planctomycetales bacterium]